LPFSIFDCIIHAMPRIARVIATGYPHHITQRGNNRATVFFDDEDRQTYLKLLAGYAVKHHLQIWAYCLMNNHIHLLAVPKTETSLARGIGLTNQVYTQYINRKLNQSGRIWQNRFFSCVVENNQYLWAVARYIERNPLKVGLVENAETYRWSSAKAHMAGANDKLLGATSWLSPEEQSTYAEFVVTEVEEADNAIRKATRTGRPFGSEDFVDLLEFQLKQPLKANKRGRPYKINGECP
jgi:putative transposase